MNTAHFGYHMEFPIRSKNKEPQCSSVYDDLFDQYIDKEHFDFGNDLYERSSSENQSTHGFDFSFPNADIAIPSIEQPTDYHHGPQDIWTNTLRRLDHNVSVIKTRDDRSTTTKYSEPDSQSASCNLDFLSLGGYPSPQLVTSPYNFSRPRPQATAQSPTRAGHQSSGVRKTIRSTKSTPNMMSPSRYRAGFKDVWKERTAQNAHISPLKLPFHNPHLSPPQSTDIEQIAGSNASSCDFDTGSYQSMAAFDNQISPLTQDFSRAQIHTPSGSPLFEPLVAPEASSWDQIASNYNAGAFENPRHGLRPTRSTWNMRQQFDSDEGSPTSPSCNPWSAANVSTRQISLAPEAPPMSSAHYHQNYSATNAGLMINYDPLLIPHLDTITLTEPEMLLPPAHHQPTPFYLDALESYPPLPPTPKYAQPPTSTSRDRRLSPSPSPPPTRSRRARATSRTNPGSSRLRSQSRQRQNHRRSKSSNPNQQSQRHSRAPRSASQGGGNGGGGAFVNLTPADSGKLLTGVAPSGSSKTKARREKEAAEKRRKFSVAAVRAVVEAGGDLDGLRGAGIVL